MMAASIMTRAERREHAREHALCFGDLTVWETILDALASVPPAAYDFALANCVFVGVGVDSRAWTSSANLADREGRHRHRLIVCGPDTTAETVAHEISHATRAALSDSPAISCAGEIGLREYAKENGLFEQFERAKANEESAAWRDAYAWLSEASK
jgi:hypothetical protein